MQSALLVEPLRAPARVAPPRAAGPDVFGSTAIAAINLPVHDAIARVREASGGDDCDAGCLQFAAYTEADSAPALDRAALQEVNSAVNAAIRYREDRALYGQGEYWASAAETFDRGAGDCEDIAIAKMAVLTAMGADPRDLYLIVLRDTRRQLLHAVLAVRSGAELFVLDNVSDAVRPESAVRDYRPLYSVSAAGAWVHGVTLAHR